MRGRVGFAPFTVLFDVLGRHLFDGMAELREFARPVVRRAAGFHADQTRRLLGEEIQHLTAPQLTLHQRVASGIDAVDLKHGLGQIQPARSNPPDPTRVW